MSDSGQFDREWWCQSSCDLSPESGQRSGRRSDRDVGAYARQPCRMAFLAPDIQRAILEERQPPGFNLEGLVHGSIPLAWADQRSQFGF